MPAVNQDAMQEKGVNLHHPNMTLIAPDLCFTGLELPSGTAVSN